MAYVQQNTSPVWPPSGIALAALLLAGIRYWPGIALGVVAGSLLTGAPLGMALGFGTANTLEALIAAVLLKKWIKFDVNPPERVDIPRLFELEGVYDRQMWDGVVRDPADFALRNRLRFWFDNQDRARAAYASVTVKADACTDCRYCEPRCPYRLPIVSKLRHAHYKLSGAPVL
jgi:NAD-dependent dihydropyrimidine dehydrogenase PreA subunit